MSSFFEQDEAWMEIEVFLFYLYSIQLPKQKIIRWKYMLKKNEKLAAKIELKGKQMMLTIFDEGSHTFSLSALKKNPN